MFEQTCRAHKVDKPKNPTNDKTSPPQKKHTKASAPPPILPKPTPKQRYTLARTKVVGASSTDSVDGISSRPPDIPARNTPEFCLYMYESEICPPSYWTKYTSDKSIKKWKIQEKGKPFYSLVDVDASTFTAIESLVQKTWQGDKFGHGRDAAGLKELGYNTLKLTRVQRIENLTLYENYKQMQQHFFHRAGEGKTNNILSKLLL